jgi:phosphatidylglycerophosphatase A
VQGDRAEARFLRKDPPEAVADETAGQCLALLFLPAASLAEPARAAFTLAYAFVAFRVLDIIKPFPARTLQGVPGGAGILLDDVVAGLYALALVQIPARVLLA